MEHHEVQDLNYLDREGLKNHQIRSSTPTCLLAMAGSTCFFLGGEGFPGKDKSVAHSTPSWRFAVGLLTLVSQLTSSGVTIKLSRNKSLESQK